MTYIKEENRIEIDARIERLVKDMESMTLVQNAGDLNFLITRIIHAYFKSSPNYQGINDVIGALEGAKLEFNRRVVSKYEDLKIKENGDL